MEDRVGLVLGGLGRALPSLTRDVHKFVRTVNNGYLTVPLADSGFSAAWTLADLPNYTEFTALFDYYVIDKVVMHFTIFPAVGGTLQSGANLYITSDYDSASTPTLADVQQRRHLMVCLSNSRPTATFSLTPRVAAGVYNGSTVTAAGVNKGWLDIASTNIAHYGVIYYLVNYNTSQSSRIQLLTDFHIRLAGVR